MRVPSGYAKRLITILGIKLLISMHFLFIADVWDLCVRCQASCIAVCAIVALMLQVVIVLYV